jgi:hypothetical protein
MPHRAGVTQGFSLNPWPAGGHEEPGEQPPHGARLAPRFPLLECGAPRLEAHGEREVEPRCLVTPGGCHCLSSGSGRGIHRLGITSTFCLIPRPKGPNPVCHADWISVRGNLFSVAPPRCRYWKWGVVISCRFSPSDKLQLGGDKCSGRHF